MQNLMAEQRFLEKRSRERDLRQSLPSSIVEIIRGGALQPISRTALYQEPAYADVVVRPGRRLQLLAVVIPG